MDDLLIMTFDTCGCCETRWHLKKTGKEASLPNGQVAIEVFRMPNYHEVLTKKELTPFWVMADDKNIQPDYWSD